MKLDGNKDKGDSHKGSLEKAQANGFGAPMIAGRRKLDATSLFEERAIDRMESLIDKTFDAFDRALSSSDTKLAMEAANKLTRLWYQPTQKIAVEGSIDQNHTHTIRHEGTEHINEKEKEALSLFHEFLKEAADDDEVIEAEAVEVIEETDDDSTV